MVLFYFLGVCGVCGLPGACRGVGVITFGIFGAKFVVGACKLA